MLRILIGFAVGGAAMYALHERQRIRSYETVRSQFNALMVNPGPNTNVPALMAVRDAIVAELEALALITGPQRPTTESTPNA